jgi:hypothetical protein
MTDEELDDIVWDPDVVELLVAEVRRLRDGIAAHRDEQTALGDGSSMADRNLWSLLDREHTDD